METTRRGPYRRPGPWLTALRRLHDRGYCDREIAELLTDLSPSAIATLEATGRWGWRHVERARMPLAGGGKPWTAAAVRAHRRQLGLPGNPTRFECGSLLEVRRCRQREYQRAHGWGHLLPTYDDITGQWNLGYELRRRETDILNLLADRGPQTRPELLLALHVRNLHSHGRSCLVRLQLAGLVRYDHRPRHLGVYRLTERARPQTDPQRMTGLETLLARWRVVVTPSSRLNLGEPL